MEVRTRDVATELRARMGEIEKGLQRFDTMVSRRISSIQLKNRIDAFESSDGIDDCATRQAHARAV